MINPVNTLLHAILIIAVADTEADTIADTLADTLAATLANTLADTLTDRVEKPGTKSPCQICLA